MADPGYPLVSFTFKGERHLLESLAEYVADGLWQGGRVIVIATGEHRTALDERLRSNGIDVASAVITRQYDCGCLLADAPERERARGLRLEHFRVILTHA